MKFPTGFLWGTATAAHQVEGNNVYNDSWLFEHVPGTAFAEPSGDACDHYHRYPKEIALLAGLGFNRYRFSIEWARIEPEEGEFSRASLDHYRRMLIACHEHGLTPMVTFHCLQDGLGVRGYTYWSAFDNFEWMRGYGPTFGLIAVDRETQTRTVKPSARWLGADARANGLERNGSAGLAPGIE